MSIHCAQHHWRLVQTFTRMIPHGSLAFTWRAHHERCQVRLVKMEWGCSWERNSWTLKVASFRCFAIDPMICYHLLTRCIAAMISTFALLLLLCYINKTTHWHLALALSQWFTLHSICRWNAMMIVLLTLSLPIHLSLPPPSADHQFVAILLRKWVLQWCWDVKRFSFNITTPFWKRQTSSNT